MLIYLQDFYNEIADRIFKPQRQQENVRSALFTRGLTQVAPHQQAAGLSSNQSPARLEALFSEPYGETMA